MFSSLLPADGHIFGKERRIWGLTAKDGVEEKTLVSWTVAYDTRTKGPGQGLGTLHRDWGECIWQTILS